MVTDDPEYDDEAEGKGGDDTRPDTRPDRRHQSRRGSDWSGPGRFLFKVAASAGGVVFAVGFLMSVLGWRFTGNADQIRVNSGRLTSLETRMTMLERQSEAAVWMVCALYRDKFPDAPVRAECPRSDP